MMQTCTIAVLGSSQIQRGDQEYENARRLGRSLARAGYRVLVGDLQGIQGTAEAVSLGVREVDGYVVGLTGQTPFQTKVVDESVRCTDIFAFLENLVTRCDGFVALKVDVPSLGSVSAVWKVLSEETIPYKPLILVGEKWMRLLETFRRGLDLTEKQLATIAWVESIEQVTTVLGSHFQKGEGPK